MQYHLAAGDPIFSRDAVQKIVVDGIIRWGLQQGAEQFHLGGGVGASSDSLLRFKLGFGGAELPYHTIRIVCDPDAVARATEAWKRRSKDAPTSDFFPAYRRAPASND
jgi:hypothetical protein